MEAEDGLAGPESMSSADGSDAFSSAESSDASIGSVVRRKGTRRGVGRGDFAEGGRELMAEEVVEGGGVEVGEAKVEEGGAKAGEGGAQVGEGEAQEWDGGVEENGEALEVITITVVLAAVMSLLQMTLRIPLCQLIPQNQPL